MNRQKKKEEVTQLHAFARALGQLRRSQARTAATAGIDRTVLPIPEPDYPRETKLDARDAKAPPRFEVKAPQGAPNVIVFLIDDIGFGHPSTFGGAIPMPTLDRLASQGLKYNRFHTTALCSPTRVALLTGRNHHTNNAGAIMEVATAFPGNTGARPQSVTPLAEILRQNGYSTSAFGKYHETAPWEVSVSGPVRSLAHAFRLRQVLRLHRRRDQPVGAADLRRHGQGGGAARPELPLHDRHDEPGDPAGSAAQQSLTPDKPFFTYFATGATHAPHHVPKEWIAKFKGKFDGGWDKYREETFARQKQLGIIPQDAKLAAKPADIKDWDKLTADEKRLFARQMEVFAAFAAHTDHEIGRVVKAIEDLGELDNTLILYLVGDNGASAEGGMIGMFNEMTYFNGVAGDGARHARRTSTSGAAPRPSRTWRRAGPWPATRPSCGPSRSPPTSAARATRSSSAGPPASRPRARSAASSSTWWTSRRPCSKRPVSRSRRRSTAWRRRRWKASAWCTPSTIAKAAGRHKTQYFEIFGNRAIYHDGWVAATVHKAPWEAEPRRKLAEDVWELYNVDEDFSETNDLAASNPAKLKELQALFMKEAETLPRAADRRPGARAVRPRHGGPSGPDGRPQVAHGLRGHDGHDGERVHQREEPVGDDHGRRGDSRRRRERRDPLPRAAASADGASTSRTASRPTRTTSSVSRSTRSTPASGSRPARRRSSSTSPTTATDAARAARPRSSSTTRRSDRDASSKPTPTSSPPTTPPTWAWTKGPT